MPRPVPSLVPMNFSVAGPPPPSVIVPAPLRLSSSFVTASVPRLTVKAPVKVFAVPVRASIPGPAAVTLPLPLIAPEKV